jgi:hypothetical protein
MKYLFLVTLTIVSFSTYSQSTDTTFKKQPNTNLEKVNMKVGTIIRKEFIDLYNYEAKGLFNSANLKAKVLKMRDALTGSEIAGIILSTLDVGSGSKYSAGKTYNAYVDAEEIPALIKYLEFIESLKDKTETNYTEYLFNSKDLQLFAYYSQGLNKKWGWHYGIEIDKYYSGSRVDLNLETLMELKNALSKSGEYFKVPDLKVIPSIN